MKSKILNARIAIPMTVLMVTIGLLLLATAQAYLSAPLGLLALIWFVTSYVHDLFNPIYPRGTDGHEK